MILRNVAKHSWLIPFGVCSSLLAASPLYGQAPPAPQDQIKVLARISKQFIEDVAAREDVVATVPYNAKVLGFRAQGVANGLAKLSVDFRTAPDEATFIVSSYGSSQIYARAIRGPIVAMGPATIPFTSQTFVRFDGRKFHLGGTTPAAPGHFQLDRIERRPRRPVGAARGRFVPSVGLRLVPRAEAEARPIGEYYVKSFADGFAEEIVTKLDRTTPVEKSLNRLFPEMRDWGFHMSADSQFLQAAFGPPGST